ncbi:MAG: hypothetical protein ACFFDB_00275 [Promethearchaeota archaeon]
MEESDFELKSVIKKKGSYTSNQMLNKLDKGSLAIFLKEVLLTLAIILGIVSMVISTMLEHTIITKWVWEISWIIITVIIMVLLFNIVLYHRKHPERKNYEPMYYMLALSFICLNWTIEIVKYLGSGISSTDSVIMMINYSLVLLMLSLALIRAMVHKIKISKTATEENNPPKMMKISSVSAAVLGVIFTVIIADAVIISLNSGTLFSGATTIDKLWEASSPLDTLRTILIIVGTAIGLLAIEIKYDILFDFDDPLWDWFRAKFRRK